MLVARSSLAAEGVATPRTSRTMTIGDHETVCQEQESASAA